MYDAMIQKQFMLNNGSESNNFLIKKLKPIFKIQQNKNKKRLLSFIINDRLFISYFLIFMYIYSNSSDYIPTHLPI